MQDSPNNAEELKHRIERAFGEMAYPGDDNITISNCDCEECNDTREFFQGKHWSELAGADQNLMGLWGGLSILSPDAWRFYLPAYLIVGLGEGSDDYSSMNPAEDARDSVLFAIGPPTDILPPNDPDRIVKLFVERTSGFSAAQQACIAAYASAMSELDPEVQNCKSTATYWQDRVASVGIA
jgi:hypothetical protein